MISFHASSLYFAGQSALIWSDETQRLQSRAVHQNVSAFMTDKLPELMMLSVRPQEQDLHNIRPSEFDLQYMMKQ